MGRRAVRIALLSLVLTALLSTEALPQGQPDGQLAIAFDASIAPPFLDPAEAAGLGTPFTFLHEEIRLKKR